MVSIDEVVDAIDAQRQAYENLQLTKKNVENALDDEDKQELESARAKAFDLLDAAALDKSLGTAFGDATALHRAETEAVAAELTISEAWRKIWSEPDHSGLKQRLDDAQRTYNQAKRKAAEIIQQYVEGN